MALSLHAFSTRGVFSTRLSSSSFFLLHRNIHIISPSLLDANVINFTNYHNDNNRRVRVRRRTIWTSTPLCMGRRSCKIAGRKEANNAKKMKLYSRIGKEVVSAVKKGGPNVTSNSALAAVLEKVKELDVPKDIVERNIKKATEKGQEDYIEKIYEGNQLCLVNVLGYKIGYGTGPATPEWVYGYGGVSMVVEVSTDKITRSVAKIREVIKDYGGKMADSGSVLFKFRRARVVSIKVTNADKDHLLGIALDAGAEDVIDPPTYEDDTEEDRSER